ncbi:hypothetical protein CTAYLR_003057 [Chrysophaeum taylorii]|uniref:Uncharacterized protein n=1 Tax=Chrysophaeum taylorii TaxID=2483200 RepID=A0AAD7U5I3_9STRA|nr:hypothetical protein CTAYLR_003057 [Chrysophaeum taylorii]
MPITGPPEVVLLSKGKASALRLEAEPNGIGAALDQLDESERVRLVECTHVTLEATLKRVCGKGQRVWLHLLGHHCATAPEEGTHSEEVLHVDSVGEALELVRDIIDTETSFGAFVNLIKQAGPSLELVFCNASHTRTLADALAPLAFGWATACVEEGAVLFASFFYDAIAHGFPVEHAFENAMRSVTNPPALLLERQQRREAAAKTRAPARRHHPPLAALRRYSLDDPWMTANDDRVVPSRRADGWHPAAAREAYFPREVTVADMDRDLDDVFDIEQQRRVKRRRVVSDTTTSPRADLPRQLAASGVGDERTLPPPPEDPTRFRRLRGADKEDGTGAVVSAKASSDVSRRDPPKSPPARSRKTRSSLVPPGLPATTGVWAAMTNKKDFRPEDGTPLKPSTLVGIGEAKINKLSKLGIMTIEALAWVDLTDASLAVRATGNRAYLFGSRRRWDEAIQTLTRWRDTANQYLDNRLAHELRAISSKQQKAAAASSPTNAATESGDIPTSSQPCVPAPALVRHYARDDSTAERPPAVQQ